MTRSGLLFSALCAALTLAGASAASAAPEPAETVEKKVKSAAPNARKVRESLVRIRDPLPAEVGPHPAAAASKRR